MVHTSVLRLATVIKSVCTSPKKWLLWTTLFHVLAGMAPFHVQRWSSFYYTGGFLLSFMAGVGSYREKCFQKIMALENSTLKQQVKERFSSQR